MQQHKRLIDAGKYAVLAACTSGSAQEGTTVKPESVGGYRTKMVQAGDFMYISAYPLIGCAVNMQQREMLEKLRSACEQNPKLRAKYIKYNNKRRIREFEQLVHTNIRKNDLHVTCTYAVQDYRDYNSLTFRLREDACREIYNFLRRTKRMLQRHGYDPKEFRWICVTVTKQDHAETARPLPDKHHHHLLIHGIPPELRNELESLWPHGYCNADRLRDSDDGLSSIAGYVARQESSSNGENGGERSFTTSRNILRPKVTTSDSRISRRRIARIAADIRTDGREILENSLFPGFRLVGDPDVKTSDFVAGAYIYAKLRRIQPEPVKCRKSGRLRI